MKLLAPDRTSACEELEVRTDNMQEKTLDLKRIKCNET